VSTPALDDLVESLTARFHRGSPGGAIAELLGQYAGAHDDWRAFALFSTEQYTRNLVVQSEHYELMILCWGAGQESPIHNHEGQDCWMAVLDGEMEELRYAMPSVSAPGPLLPKSSHRFACGQVAFIRDEMGLHLVRPLPGLATGGVTLHLYAAPYDECNCYCPRTGVVTRKKLAHHSVRGRLMAPGAART